MRLLCDLAITELTTGRWRGVSNAKSTPGTQVWIWRSFDGQLPKMWTTESWEGHAGQKKVQAMRHPPGNKQDGP
jgi:hypothetical protein